MDNASTISMSYAEVEVTEAEKWEVCWERDMGSWRTAMRKEK